MAVFSSFSLILAKFPPQPFLASRGQPRGGRGGGGGGGGGVQPPQPRLAAAWNTPNMRCDKFNSKVDGIDRSVHELNTGQQRLRDEMQREFERVRADFALQIEELRAENARFRAAGVATTSPSPPQPPPPPTPQLTSISLQSELRQLMEERLREMESQLMERVGWDDQGMDLLEHRVRVLEESKDSSQVERLIGAHLKKVGLDVNQVNLEKKIRESHQDVEKQIREYNQDVEKKIRECAQDVEKKFGNVLTKWKKKSQV